MEIDRIEKSFFKENFYLKIILLEIKIITLKLFKVKLLIKFICEFTVIRKAFHLANHLLFRLILEIGKMTKLQ